MKAWLPAAVLSLLLGFLLGCAAFMIFGLRISAEYAPYLSIAALAGLDTLFGGVRAGIEGRFQNDIFASGLLLNTILAAALAWLGDRIGVNLKLVVMLTLGSRVFLNLSLIRRYFLNSRAMSRTRQMEDAAAAASAAPSMAQKTEMGGGI